MEGRARSVAERITTRYLTKYERARVLGTRALQIRFVAGSSRCCRKCMCAFLFQPLSSCACMRAKCAVQAVALQCAGCVVAPATVLVQQQQQYLADSLLCVVALQYERPCHGHC
jgi:hypothetical protein